MKDLNLIYYSPTGTTQKIIREIAKNLGIETSSETNITKSKDEFDIDITEESLTIIGIPVYGGRLPLESIEQLKKINSNQSPVVIVVVYGNRNFDDALLELKEIASNCGFKIIAAAAFIGEHSFSTDEKPIAKERPDAQDLIKCNDFALMIKEKLSDFNNIKEIEVSGNYPYKERKPLPVDEHPETNSDLCNHCGTCIEICPTNAISSDGDVTTDGELCTWCCACVKVCPNGARVFDKPIVNAIKEKLFVNFSKRREPEFFI